MPGERDTPTTTLRLSLEADELIEPLARRVAELVQAQSSERQDGSPWMDVAGAAAYLGNTTTEAVRALVKRRAIPFKKAPNGRLLFDRAELDALVRGGAA